MRDGLVHGADVTHDRTASCPDLGSGNEPPDVRVRPPGPASRAWLERASRVSAPMGPRVVPGRPRAAVVYRAAWGSNVLDVDGNRYVDLCGGFGAQLLGHRHPAVTRALGGQLERLWQALGDVHPADAKIALLERLAGLFPARTVRGILGQSGADAVTAALKTAVLVTGRPGVVAFQGSYHGLSYAPLAASGLRGSYRDPFAAQLNPHVAFVEYPASPAGAAAAVDQVAAQLRQGHVGAVLIEPVLGRGGCVVPPAGFLAEVARRCRDAGALLIADEIWTGLGRAGAALRSVADGVVPDLVCLGKGLGGGLPVSACLGHGDLMDAWSRDAEVVHTATFTGAPLPAAAALSTLDVLERERLDERAVALGDRLRAALAAALPGRPVRGRGLMIGVELGGGPGAAVAVARRLLERGYLTSTGGGAREVLVLTPPLTIDEALLEAFVPALVAATEEGAG